MDSYSNLEVNFTRNDINIVVYSIMADELCDDIFICHGFL